MLRKPPERLLGEDQTVIDRDLENATAAFDQPGIDARRLPDIGRQTGGPRKIVSNPAVLDADLHWASLLRATASRAPDGDYNAEA